MKAIVLKCRPGSHFHFGKYTHDADTALNDSNPVMHSDTLFAAIINTWQDYFEDAQVIVDAFANGSVKISSLFFCLEQSKKYIWFLPKPVSFDLYDAVDYKSFRGIRFISKKAWELLEHPAELMDDTKYKMLSRNTFAICRDEVELSLEFKDEQERDKTTGLISLYNIQTLPKVNVRDVAEARGIYHLTVTELATNTQLATDLQVHYYFLMDVNGLDEDLYKQLHSAILMLQHNGIGGERSTIGGISEIEIIENWQLSIPVPPSMHSATLSLFSPAPGDLNKMKYYKTLMRGGRRLGKAETVVENEETKAKNYLKSARMAAEGAIVQDSIEGVLVNVSPTASKPYLRNGKPLCLPIRSQWIPLL